MTEQEIIDVVTHFKNGGKIEKIIKGSLFDFELDTEPNWNFGLCEYRKKPEKKTRLMNAEELIGKVIICEYHRTMMRGKGIYRHLVSSCDEESVYIPHMDKMWVEIKGLNDLGWTLEDGSPLIVEVE